MASIRKHRSKWQVQIRRSGSRPISKSFINKTDAQIWARQTEIQADRRDLPKDPRLLERIKPWRPERERWGLLVGGPNVKTSRQTFEGSAHQR